jgi:hypothetical protein
MGSIPGDIGPSRCRKGHASTEFFKLISKNVRKRYWEKEEHDLQLMQQNILSITAPWEL